MTFHRKRPAAILEGKVAAVRFGLLSPEQIRGAAVTRCHHGHAANKQFATGAANDITMGVVNRSFECPTCFSPLLTCPGHYGAVETGMPVVMPFLADRFLHTIARLCPCCSETAPQYTLEMKRKLLSVPPDRRLDMMKQLVKTSQLPRYCGESAQIERKKGAKALDEKQIPKFTSQSSSSSSSESDSSSGSSSSSSSDSEDSESSPIGSDADGRDSDGAIGTDDESGSLNDDDDPDLFLNDEDDQYGELDANNEDIDYDSDGNPRSSRRRKRPLKKRKKKIGKSKAKAVEEDYKRTKLPRLANRGPRKDQNPAPSKRRKHAQFLSQEGDFKMSELKTFGCGAPIPRYRRTDKGTILADYVLDWKGDPRKSIWPKHNGWHLYRMLCNVSPEVHELFGHDYRLSHMRSMMMTNLLIPPPIIRQKRDEKKHTSGSSSSHAPNLDEMSTELRDVLMKQKKLMNRFHKDGVMTHEDLPSHGMTVTWITENGTRVKCECTDALICQCILKDRYLVKHKSLSPSTEVMLQTIVTPAKYAMIEAERKEFEDLEKKRLAILFPPVLEPKAFYSLEEKEQIHKREDAQTMWIQNKHRIPLDLLASRRPFLASSSRADIFHHHRHHPSNLQRSQQKSSAAPKAAGNLFGLSSYSDSKPWELLADDYNEALITYTIGELNRKGVGRKEQKSNASPWAAGASQQNAAQKRGQSLITPLVGKKGLIRGAIHGRRLNLTARSVAQGSMFIEIDQVSVPSEVAKTLTISAPLQKYNQAHLIDLMRSSRVEFIRTEKNELLNSRFLGRDTYVPYIGQKFERHMESDDYVVGNRQPTLHIPSMQGLRLHIIQSPSWIKRCRGFRVNQSACEAYNMDFDGDEMNLYAMEGWPAIAEVATSMGATRQVRSQQGDCLILGLVQNSKLGIFRLTQDGVWLSKLQFDQLIQQFASTSAANFAGNRRHASYGFLQRAFLKPVASDHPENKDLYSGKLLVSCLLPPGVFYKEKHVWIQNSKIVSGYLKGSDIATRESGNLIHAMVQDVGEADTLAWMSGMQRMLSYWLTQTGDTISIRDYQPSAETEQKMDNIIEKAIKWCTTFEENYDMKRFNVAERKIHSMLDYTRAAVFQTMKRELLDRKKLPGSHRNGAMDLIESGAKGKDSHLQHLGALLGQQMPFSGRILGNIAHFHAMIGHPGAHGFIAESYRRGISPFSFYGAAIVGRQGLVNIGSVTPNTGYMQTRLERCLSDYTARSDRTVRDSRHAIVQCTYAEAGFNPAFMESNPLRWQTPKEATSSKLQAGKDQVMQSFALLYSMSRFFPDSFLLPFKIQRALTRYAMEIPPAESASSSSSSSTICQELIQKWFYDMIHEKRLLFEYEGVNMPHHNLLLWTVLEDMLTPFVLNKYGYERHPPALSNLLAFLEKSIARAIIPAGEAVGPIAGQSIVEPITQMNLGSFKTPGTNDALAEPITLINNYINACKKRTGVGMSVFLNNQWNETAASARHVAKALVERNLLYFVDSLVHIPVNTSPPNFPKWVLSALARRPPLLQDAILNQSHKYPTFCVEFSPERCADAKLGAVEMACMLLKHPKQGISIIHNGKWTMYLTSVVELPLGTTPTAAPTSNQITASENLIREAMRETMIRGIPKIRSAKPKMFSRKRYDTTTKTIITTQEWGVSTQGSNLDALSHLACVNLDLCTTTFIHDIKKVLGIVAVKLWLVENLVELTRTYQSRVDVSHFKLVADVMTRTGDTTPMTRYGLKNSTTAALPLLFENAPEHLRNLSATAARDPIAGIIEATVMGNEIPVGTGTIKICGAAGGIGGGHILKADVPITLQGRSSSFELQHGMRRIPCESKPLRFYQTFVQIDRNGEFTNTELVSSWPVGLEEENHGGHESNIICNSSSDDGWKTWIVEKEEVVRMEDDNMVSELAKSFFLNGGFFQF